jgi:multicomponent Na+:H+ antiporter subunit D
VGSLLTLVSMVKIWSGVFWGELSPAHVAPRIVRRNGLMSSATIVTVALGLGIAAFAGPVVRYTQRAADELRTPPVAASPAPARAVGPVEAEGVSP